MVTETVEIKMNKKHVTYGIIFIMLINFASISWLFYTQPDNQAEHIEIINTTNETNTIEEPEATTLKSILRNIINENHGTIEDGACLEYALLYEEILNRAYPKLDVRRIERAKICPIGETICGEREGIPHTYLIVNGIGAECILDQNKLACIQVING